VIIEKFISKILSSRLRTKISETTSDNNQSDERVSYAVERGRGCFPHCSATACRKPGLIKCCVRSSQPGHIAVPRLNSEQRIPHRKSTDSLAKGYNRKIHIKRRRCWRIRKFQSQYHRMSRWKEGVDWARVGGVGGCKNFLWVARRAGKISSRCFPFCCLKRLSVYPFSSVHVQPMHIA
jgi:hypothetical protein